MMEWLGVLAGFDGITFNFLLGKLFIPVAWMIGIPVQVSKKTTKNHALLTHDDTAASL